jgi:hypothetical protein
MPAAGCAERATGAGGHSTAGEVCDAVSMGSATAEVRSESVSDAMVAGDPIRISASDTQAAVAAAVWTGAGTVS